MERTRKIIVRYVVSITLRAAGSLGLAGAHMTRDWWKREAFAKTTNANASATEVIETLRYVLKRGSRNF